MKWSIIIPTIFVFIVLPLSIEEALPEDDICDDYSMMKYKHAQNNKINRHTNFSSYDFSL